MASAGGLAGHRSTSSRTSSCQPRRFTTAETRPATNTRRRRGASSTSAICIGIVRGRCSSTGCTAAGFTSNRISTKDISTMKTYAVAALVAACLVAAPQVAHAELRDLTKKVGSTTLHYKVVLPNGYDAAKAYPAILAL